MMSSCALVHECQLDRGCGWCPAKDHEALSCSVSLKAGGQSIQQGSINARSGVEMKGNYYVCLPSVYHMWPDLPGFSPIHLHTASDQKLEARTKMKFKSTVLTVLYQGYRRTHDIHINF